MVVDRLRQASRARRDQQKIELRKLILDAARDLFDGSGYETFSLRQVAERIGYSPTTIYLYFADKDALLAAVMDQGFDEFVVALRSAADAQPDPLFRLRDLGRAYVDFGLNHSVHYRMMFMQRSDLLLITPEQGAEPRIASFHVLRAAVIEAQAHGLIRPGDPLAVANTLWSLVHGITSLAIGLPSLWTPDLARAYADTSFEMLINGIATRPQAA